MRYKDLKETTFEVLGEDIVHQVKIKNKSYCLVNCDDGYQLKKQEKISGKERTWYYEIYPTYKEAVEELEKFISEEENGTC